MPCLGDIDLHDVTLLSKNATNCDNECCTYCRASPNGLWLSSLHFFDQAIIDIATRPRYICLLLFLLLLRNIYTKHDYFNLKGLYTSWVLCRTFFQTPTVHHSMMRQTDHIGGGVSELFSFSGLQPHLIKNSINIRPSPDVMYAFNGHYLKHRHDSESMVDDETLHCHIPLHNIISNLTIPSLKLVAAVHGIYIKSRTPLPDIIKIIQDHNCDHCQPCITVFKTAKSLAKRRREANVKAVRKYKSTKICLNVKVSLKTPDTVDIGPDQIGSDQTFPPSPLNRNMEHNIVKAWCKNMSPYFF